MKHQIIIDVDAGDDWLPETNVTGEIAKGLAQQYLERIEVSRLRINRVDEPVVAKEMSA